MAAVRLPHSCAKRSQIGVGVDEFPFNRFQRLLIVPTVVKGNPMPLELLLLANSSPRYSFTHELRLSHTGSQLAQKAGELPARTATFARSLVLGLLSNFAFALSRGTALGGLWSG